VAVPFRRGQRWAWWAAWIVMIADLGYTFTFGIRDHVILVRSLVVDVALAVLLLACYRNWGQGIWTDYGAELARRACEAASSAT
jgi:hypothetical protein